MTLAKDEQGWFKKLFGNRRLRGVFALGIQHLHISLHEGEFGSTKVTRRFTYNPTDEQLLRDAHIKLPKHIYYENLDRPGIIISIEDLRARRK